LFELEGESRELGPSGQVEELPIDLVGFDWPLIIEKSNVTVRAVMSTVRQVFTNDDSSHVFDLVTEDPSQLIAGPHCN
jgi:hypothetical protein